MLSEGDLRSSSFVWRKPQATVMWLANLILLTEDSCLRESTIYTSETQLGQGRVLPQRLGQNAPHCHRCCSLFIKGKRNIRAQYSLPKERQFGNRTIHTTKI